MVTRITQARSVIEKDVGQRYEAGRVRRLYGVSPPLGYASYAWEDNDNELPACGCRLVRSNLITP